MVLRQDKHATYESQVRHPTNSAAMPPCIMQLFNTGTDYHSDGKIAFRQQKHKFYSNLSKSDMTCIKLML